MGTRISELSASVTVLRQVIKAADANQDNVLSPADIARVGIQDGSVTKTILSAAASVDGPTITAIERVFEGAVKSATRADARGERDGVYAAAERQASSSMAQLLGTFTDVNGGKTLADFKVGSVAAGPVVPAVSMLTQRAYQDALKHFGQPNFGPAQQVPLAQVPAAARAKIEAMLSENKGARLQVATWSVNGEQVYFAHAIDGDHAEVIGVAANGSVYAKGVALEEANSWNISWRRN